MAFLTQRFPVGISFGAIGGPGFATNVVTIRSGAEQRNANWSTMRHAWDVAQALKTNADFAAVRAHFLAAEGKLNGFPFKDWADYQAAAGEGVLTVIDSTHWQLAKRYTSGSSTTDRAITKPVSGTVVITGGSGHTLDYTTGILTKGTGTPTAWTGEFDVPARYDVDQLKAHIVDRNTDGVLLAWDSIPIVEIRV